MKKMSLRLSENLSYKIVALLITLILWVIIFTSKESAMEKTVPVQYNISQEMVLLNKLPVEVRFRVVGARMVLKKVAEDNDPIVVDLSAAREGVSTIRIHSDSLNLPQNAKIIGIMPPLITVRLERLISKIVPVEVPLSGELPKGRKLIKISPQPELWEVFGARSEVAKVLKAKTQSLDLTSISQAGVVELPLDLTEYSLDPKSQGNIKVQVVVK